MSDGKPRGPVGRYAARVLRAAWLGPVLRSVRASLSRPAVQALARRAWGA